MTLTGTNSYVIDAGDGTALVIDPGPFIERHVEALVANASARDLRIATIALTHGHPDHAPAAAPLARLTGARVYAHPDSRVARDGDLPLEADFATGDLSLRVMDAPGHTFEHVVFYDARERALFTGDVILGEGTVVIAPPGGAMRPYVQTLGRLATEFSQARTIYGGHGPVVENAQEKIAEYIAHREVRESELIAALEDGPATIPELVMKIYGAQRPILWPAMARQMLAYLIALGEEGAVTATRVEREMDERERAILNPPWETIVGPEHAALVEEELGGMLKLDALYRYALVNR